jgi:hypothetical protein
MTLKSTDIQKKSRMTCNLEHSLQCVGRSQQNATNENMVLLHVFGKTRIQVWCQRPAIFTDVLLIPSAPLDKFLVTASTSSVCILPLLANNTILRR